ncbi:MAG: beta-CASP ribonuclease aCPSF1, partial [Methanosarcina sp.]|nr:beta-CASP ribonuclease aCPSF1 [Methanosarcina sp.]
MPIEDVLLDLKNKIEKNLPAGVTITDVEFEGPQLVLYTEEPRKFADDGNIIRNLAKELRTRIAMRPDPRVLATPEDSISIIEEVVPKESVISSYYFDPDSGEVIIEAEKPGLVIGKHGATLREITKQIGWIPKVVRTPPIKSRTVKNIREFMRNNLKERKEILKTVGRKIHRECTSKDQWVRVTALGGCKEVGRSCFLLSTPESRILIDCGVNVGSDENMTPYLYVPEVFPLSHIDAVIVTHAHLDHQGLVPLLFKYGYEGPVYCTPPTRDLMVLLQLDYIDVAAKEGKKSPYESGMITKTLKHTIPLDYEEVTDIAPDIKLTFHNAGHILGSAISHFHIGDGLHNVVFTGDYKYEKTRLFDPAVNKFPRVETVITEATYGNSNAFQPAIKDAEKHLQMVVKNTVERGGIALIPAFAVGRSQEVMIVLEESIRKGIIP